ncbi:hypothetical protein CEXT_444151 [Caerostris extrusa]|uniref:Uncharacterized protein n=1 Tax=Caerostris extrusa TaxID=172846 RepID=A0AAV4P7A6_CAEEX|nr:hypothetical protein CEXT_444151 [Caerostris extrusa]
MTHCIHPSRTQNTRHTNNTEQLLGLTFPLIKPILQWLLCTPGGPITTIHLPMFHPFGSLLISLNRGTSSSKHTCYMKPLHQKIPVAPPSPSFLSSAIPLISDGCFWSPHLLIPLNREGVVSPDFHLPFHPPPTPNREPQRGWIDLI